MIFCFPNDTRRLFKKIVAAVSRAVEDIVEFMAEGLGCLGIGVEFFSTGYGQELTSAVGVGVGLSAGAPQLQYQLDFFRVGHRNGDLKLSHRGKCWYPWDGTLAV